MKHILRILSLVAVVVMILCISSKPCRECGAVHAEETGSASIPVTATPSTPIPTAPQVASAAGPLPKLVDLGAGKCIACKKMAPILEQAEKDYAGIAEIVFIDVWKDRTAGSQYGIRMIPTQVFFDESGKEVWRHEGLLLREEIDRKFAEMGVQVPGTSGGAGGAAKKPVRDGEH